MKIFKCNIHVFLVAALLVSAVACRQNHKDADLQQPVKNDTLTVHHKPVRSYHIPKDIAEVKEFYAVWEQKAADGSFNKVSFEYNCLNEKNGRFTYFFEDGKLRIMEHAYNEYDHFSATDRYYIADGSPFFVYSREVAWSFEAEGKTKDSVTEYRGYLVGGKPAECLAKNYILRSHGNNPKPEEIPNKVSGCSKVQKLMLEFQKMANYRQAADMECN